ncbi:MAG: ATP-binding protein [Lachnospiraceae bacterium]|nr:ATP-binding protein [Lachnospiraceae bacterium]
MNVSLIYDEIEREYDRRRQENLRIELTRKQEIASVIPELAQMIEEARSASLAGLVERLEKGDSASAEGSPLSSLKQKKAELLKKNGYPEDYLEPVFSCKDCEDTGYLRDVYGKRSIRCKCFSEKLFTRLSEASGLAQLIKTENFDHLSDAYYEGEDLVSFKKCEKLCRDFASNSDQCYQNFLFYGNIGTGKSFLSCCVANELLKQGKSVLYFSCAAIFDRLADLRFSDRDEEKQAGRDLQQDLYDCDLLILDDLGTERVNQFTVSELFSLLNERMLRQKSTIISTNLSFQGLHEMYSERVISRLMTGYKLCKFSGKDIRKEKIRERSQMQSS